MSEEDQKSLFKLFGKIEKTHHLNKKGCGLGLTICKKLMKKMG
jgi:signal transduction histidine kinase